MDCAAPLYRTAASRHPEVARPGVLPPALLLSSCTDRRGCGELVPGRRPRPQGAAVSQSSPDRPRGAGGRHGSGDRAAAARGCGSVRALRRPAGPAAPAAAGPAATRALLAAGLVVTAVLAGAALLAACGGSSGGAPPPPASPGAAPSTSAAPTAAAPGSRPFAGSPAQAVAAYWALVDAGDYAGLRAACTPDSAAALTRGVQRHRARPAAARGARAPRAWRRAGPGRRAHRARGHGDAVGRPGHAHAVHEADRDDGRRMARDELGHQPLTEWAAAAKAAESPAVRPPAVALLGARRPARAASRAAS